MKNFIRILLCLSIPTICACSKVSEERDCDSAVTFNFEIENEGTKSQFSSGDNINTAYRAVYTSDGSLVSGYPVSIKDGETTLSGLTVSSTYTFAVQVNMPGFSFPSNYSSLASTSYSNLTVSNIKSNGIPMAGTKTCTPASQSNKVTVTVKRLFAKLNFTFNSNFSYGGYTVSSITLKNCAKSLCPFTTTNKASSVQDGDYAGTVTSGSTTTFYVPENICGNAGISSNIDSWTKEPADGSLATYLEVIGTWDSTKGACTSTNTYRLYLGSNNTNNFDVVRNTIYTLSMSVSDSSYGKENAYWKIDRDLIGDNRGLDFQGQTVNVKSYSGETLHYGYKGFNLDNSAGTGYCKARFWSDELSTLGFKMKGCDGVWHSFTSSNPCIDYNTEGNYTFAIGYFGDEEDYPYGQKFTVNIQTLDLFYDKTFYVQCEDKSSTIDINTDGSEDGDDEGKNF